MARLMRRVLSGSGTWTVPAGVTRVWVFGTGGGGGGGAGCSGQSSSTTIEPSGGAGGGAGEAFGQWLDVTPGEELTYQCGSGGSAGAASGTMFGNAGGPGGNGGTTLLHNADYSINLLWQGGQGGDGGGRGDAAGFAVGGGRNAAIAEDGIDDNGYITIMPGYGGWGHFSSATTYGYSRSGQYSYMCSARVYSAFAGLQGTFPGNSGSYKSGGGGGGGGFADWPILDSGVPGIPGYGGNGGTANSGGAALSAGQPGLAATGFGNGGGGGGGGACASATPSLGGNGGAGAPGAIILAWVE